MWIIKIIKIKCFYPPRILNKQSCIYSCLQIQPRENWFPYVRRVYATAINFPCIITLNPCIFDKAKVFIWSSDNFSPALKLSPKDKFFLILNAYQQGKKLSCCHKLWMSHYYIFATWCRRLFIFQTMNFVRSNSLKVWNTIYTIRLQRYRDWFLAKTQ